MSLLSSGFEGFEAGPKPPGQDVAAYCPTRWWGRPPGAETTAKDSKDSRDYKDKDTDIKALFVLVVLAVP
jgi:hypothetical protein